MLVKISGSDRLADAGAVYPRPLSDTQTGWDGDAGALAEALRGCVRGEVRFDKGSRALYATDGSNYRQIPIGVVVPRDKDDVIQTVATARIRSVDPQPRRGHEPSGTML